MIDLSNYPNLSNLANSLGGVRKAALNKKLLEGADESWRKLTQQEVIQLEQEAPYAKQIMSCYITPTALLYMQNHAFFAIPTRDIIWVYGSVTTMRMNFIPYSKEHQLILIARDGSTHVIGRASTGGFSKKRPCDVAVQEMQAILAPIKPGIFFGYSDQIAGAVNSNLGSVIAAVDEKNNIQQQQYGGQQQVKYGTQQQYGGQQQVQYGTQQQYGGQQQMQYAGQQQQQYTQPVQNNGQPMQ